jgi:nifR3 family TIM-barrel protein
MAAPSHSFHIGPLPVTGNLILAPMDGYSSWPFRSLCRQLGSAVSYTEFVKAGDILDRPQYIEKKLYFTAEERPVVVQLYGHDPQTILEAALQVQEIEPDAIDINLGCPNRSITRRGAGAGLMRTPLITARIFKFLTSRLDIPVTGKIRLGWRDCPNQLLIARIIEDFGGAALAVHARIKEQGHQGPPDLAALAEIKESLQIPVIGNGGITRTPDIDSMLNATGCDGVMIGRAAIKNPWIFSGQNREEISPGEILALMEEHLDRSLSFYGREDGLVLFRKFAAGYLKPYQLDDQTRKDLLTERDPDRFKNKVNRIID